jgi:hypothetical protein
VFGVGNLRLITSAYVDGVDYVLEVYTVRREENFGALVGDLLAIGRVGRKEVARIVIGYLRPSPSILYLQMEPLSPCVSVGLPDLQR